MTIRILAALAVLCTGFIPPIFVGEVSAGTVALGDSGIFISSGSHGFPAEIPPITLSDAAEHVLSQKTKKSVSETSEKISPPDFLNEIPLSHQPRLKSPTEAEADILNAEYLYTQGRLLEKAGKKAEALRKYQRAFRYAADTDTILGNIVSLTAELERPKELHAYFKKIKNLNKIDVLALRNIALQFTQQGAWDEAVLAYRAAMNSMAVNGNPVAAVFFRLELGRSYYLQGDYQNASQCFRYVHRAMERPERYELDDEMAAALHQEAAFIFYLMADTYLLQKNADQAEALFEKAVQAERDELKNKPGLSKKAKERKRKITELTADYYRARIAYARNDLGNAKILSELVLRDLTPEAGLGLTPYKLYADTLSALGNEADVIPSLTAYYEKSPADADLGFFLAQKLLQTARRETDREKSLAYAQRSASLLKPLLKKRSPRERVADFLEIAVRTENPRKLWNALYEVFPYVDSLDDFLYVLMVASRNITAPVSETDADEASLEESLEYALENPEKSPAAEKSPDISAKNLSAKKSGKKADGLNEDGGKAEAEKSVTDLLRENLVYYSLLKQAVELGGKNTPPESPVAAWETFWKLGFLMEILENEPLTRAYYDAAAKIVTTKKADESAIPFLVERGFSRISEDEFQDAARFFRAAISHAVKTDLRASLSYYLASALIMDRQYAKALEEIENALRESPDSVLLRLQLAGVHARENRHEDAKKEYADILRQYGNDYDSPVTREVLRDARMNFSALESLRKHADFAEELLQEVLDEFPDDVGAKNDLAYLWSQQKKHLQRARNMAETSVAAEPENFSYRDTLGWVCFQIGEPETALEHLKTAAEMEKDPVIFSHLADVHLTLKNTEEAVKCLIESARLFEKYRQEGKLISDEDEDHVKNLLKEFAEAKPPDE